MQKKNYCLQKIIIKYLIMNNKIHLILLFFIILSAFFVILVTNETRVSICEKEIYLKNKKIENEKWMNLILKKNRKYDIFN